MIKDIFQKILSLFYPYDGTTEMVSFKKSWNEIKDKEESSYYGDFCQWRW